jgi:hypothetical protein
LVPRIVVTAPSCTCTAPEDEPKVIGLSIGIAAAFFVVFIGGIWLYGWCKRPREEEAPREERRDKVWFGRAPSGCPVIEGQPVPGFV